MAISKSIIISTYEYNLTRGCSFALKIICFFLNNVHLEERCNIDGAAQNNEIEVMGQSMDPANVERIPAEFNRRQEQCSVILSVLY